MKKTSSTIVLLLSVLSSSTAFAADGQTPKCSSGKINLEVYNQNLPQDNCSSRDAAGKYCISLTSFEEKGCWESEGVLWKNFNDSFSFSSIPKKIDIIYDVGNKIQNKIRPLHFTYHSGHISDNCSEVFDSDVSCTIIETQNSSGHPIYTLDIRKST